MSRSMTVGLLAAVAAAMPVVASLTHGDLFWIAVANTMTAAGLAAYLALPPTKKSPSYVMFAGAEAAQLALLLSSRD
jgi:hypothetical protein